VLRFQGYKRGIDVPGPDVLALFDEALALGRRLITPRAVVRWTQVRQRDDTVEADGVTLTIPHLDRHWGPIDQVAASTVTIGDRLEHQVAALWYVNDLLCQQGVARGLKVTNRISPGYAAWDVGEQRHLFRLCPGDRVGVSLNESCFMMPVKSISLLMGAGPAARVDHYFSQCARCWMADCAYRRAPARRTVRRP
jgi:hypothetical protein